MPISLVTCELHYTYACVHCDRRLESEPQAVRPGMVLRLPDVPVGWHELPQGLVCPDHTIQYVVDDVCVAVL